MNALVNYYEKSIEDFDYVPNANESEKIISVIEKLNENDVSPTIEVFQKYYLINVPLEIIREIFKKNFALASENMMQSISDTFARNLLMDALLKHIGINNHWPFLSSTEDYTNTFFHEFKEKCKQFNISKI